MPKILSRTLLPLCLCAVWLHLTGCATDPLCYCSDSDISTPSGDALVKIVYDWSADTAASPEGMRLWFYPVSGADPKVRDLPGRDGGWVRLPRGTYDLVSYNNDTEWITFQSTDRWDAHSCTTPRTSIGDVLSRAATVTDDEEEMHATPEELWHTGLRAQEVTDSAVITVAPSPAHRYYTFTINNVKGIDRLDAASVAFSSMSGGVMLADGTPSGESCTLPVAARIDRDGDRLTGSFVCFGPTPGKAVRASVYAVLTDGAKYRISQGDQLDVDTQIRQAADPRHVDIVIDGLTLPSVSADTTGGFQTSWDDWHDINIGIDI